MTTLVAAKPDDREQAVNRIAETSAELKLLADRHSLPMLSYLIDMVRLEACQQLDRIRRSGAGRPGG